MTWRLGTGDPTLIGWIVTAGYFLAAASCLWRYRAGHSSPDRNRTRIHRLVSWVGFGLLFLAFNKQLDLHILITEWGRHLARAQGWMGFRRTVQFWFVLGVLAALGVALGVVLWRMRRSLAEHFWLALGLCILCGFVAVRAASFHHVDFWFGQSALGLRRWHLVELAGIACILIWAWRSQSRRRLGTPGVSA